MALVAETAANVVRKLVRHNSSRKHLNATRWPSMYRGFHGENGFTVNSIPLDASKSVNQCFPSRDNKSLRPITINDGKIIFEHKQRRAARMEKRTRERRPKPVDSRDVNWKLNHFEMESKTRQIHNLNTHRDVESPSTHAASGDAVVVVGRFLGVKVV